MGWGKNEIKAGYQDRGHIAPEPLLGEYSVRFKHSNGNWIVLGGWHRTAASAWEHYDKLEPSNEERGVFKNEEQITR